MINEKKIPYAGAVLAVLAVLLIAGFYAADRAGLFTREVPEYNNAQSQTVRTRVTPPGYKHYWTDDYQFSLLYPEHFVVEEHPGADRSITVTFQDPRTLEGFQIYAVPYFETTISEERFRLDIPSGVRLEERRAEIGGTEAVRFYSNDVVLGETVELWAIRYGFLFELTAAKESEPLLENVTESWKFY